MSADEDQLHQVFLNLLVNAHQALEAVPPPRRLWVRTAAADGMVSVEVADNGPGVPAALRHQILEPFFTTKPVGAGTGLGLSVCHGILIAHGGAITVEDRPGGGARFIVTLPACASKIRSAKGRQTSGARHLRRRPGSRRRTRGRGDARGGPRPRWPPGDDRP